mgnify:CR=1 FL=1
MTARTEPPVLKTKYAFHALAWLLEPDVVLDIGSMDGADSKRFRQPPAKRWWTPRSAGC